ncbi:MAG: PAS domain S-box protein, partial [Nocardioidaceae bacterium]
MTSAEPARSGLPGEQLYRLLADSLPDAALMLYDGDLRFLLVGGAALRDAGYDPDTMTGRLLSEVVAPASLPRLEPLYRAALAGEERDLAYAGPDGARQYEVRFRPVRDDAGAVVAGLVVTHEVTERVRAAAALEESQSRWERFFTQAPVGIWIAETGPKGKVLEVNDALCALLGRTREQVLASSKEELLGPLEELERTAPLRPGVDRHVERVVVRPDGSEVVLSIDGRVVQEPDGLRSLGHFADVTDRHRAQEELQSALSFQEAVLSVIPDPVHVADAEVGTHVWTSRELGRDLGYSDAQLEAMDARGTELVHPDDMALLADSVARVAQAADGELVHVRHRALAADGSQRWIDRRKTPFRRAPDGTVEQYVSVTRDVTAEVEAEEALRSSLAFQQAVLTTSPDMVSVFDVAEGRTLWVSRSMGDMLGYDLPGVRALQGDGFHRIVHPEDLEEFLGSAQEWLRLQDGEVHQST